jgi:uncharacterized protein YdhG (YjbR/CyaY superfamily)
MKKAKTATSGAKTKSKNTSQINNKNAPKSFSEYLATAPNNSRSALKKMRETIRSVVPAEATEIISYGIPAFRHGRVLVWFGGFSDHCSLFPTAAVIAEFQKQLESYSISKGTIHFPLDKPLPIALIKRIIKARVVMNERK